MEVTGVWEVGVELCQTGRTVPGLAKETGSSVSTMHPCSPVSPRQDDMEGRLFWTDRLVPTSPVVENI
jgi:hypothetical protein